MHVPSLSSTSLQTQQDIRRFVRFAVVGMLGTLIDIVLFTLFYEWLGMPTLLANTLSYSVGILNNFVLNRTWTFGDIQRRAIEKQFLQFTLISLSALMLNNILVLTLATPLGDLFAAPQWGYLLAKVCATAAGFFWNFFANRYWTFSL
ncbi:MAG: GtrA family protein [Chloroflexaceae bacterium]|nr:GtrA family protein [Chloroflexaceae bacterium]